MCERLTPLHDRYVRQQRRNFGLENARGVYE